MMLYDAKKWEAKIPKTKQPVFLSAKQLRVDDHTRDAFIAVYDAMVKGQIPAKSFDMRNTGNADWRTMRDCGTPACMLGWANAYSNFVTNASSWSFGIYPHPPRHSSRHSSGLRNLCFPNIKGAVNVRDLKLAQQALFNWLTTSYPNWRKVMARANG